MPQALAINATTSGSNLSTSSRVFQLSDSSCQELPFMSGLSMPLCWMPSTKSWWRIPLFKACLLTFASVTLQPFHRLLLAFPSAVGRDPWPITSATFAQHSLLARSLEDWWSFPSPLDQSDEELSLRYCHLRQGPEHYPGLLFTVTSGRAQNTIQDFTIRIHCVTVAQIIISLMSHVVVVSRNMQELVCGLLAP
jgi:hypothetical protein